MFAVIPQQLPAAAAPTADTAGGILLAVIIAALVTAVVALTMLVVHWQRRKTLSLGRAFAATLAATALLSGAFLAGASVPFAPSADAVAPTRPAAQAPENAKYEGEQLPTLAFDE